MTIVFSAELSDVWVGINEEGRLACIFRFDLGDGGKIWQFRLDVPSEIAKLTQLLDYAGVKNVSKLNGQKIRVVIKSGTLFAFGSPKKDRFFKVYGDFAEAPYEKLA